MAKENGLITVKLRASVFTLGCRLNQADSALIAAGLADNGYEIVPWGEPADVLVVNSCTVTAAAGRKTRQTAHAARRRCPDSFLVVVGCDANLDERWAADSAVDLVLKGDEKSSVASHLAQRLRHEDGPPLVFMGQETRERAFTEHGVGLFLERTRANVKIQEGCNFFCSYCIVPFARGAPRSRDWDDILREVTELTRRGHKEIVLTGVNIATYDHGGRDLADLVERMLLITDSFRVRLSSTEPGDVLKRIVDIMATEPRLCRFLHLPMQYGEDSILKEMNRRYTVADFAERTRYAAERVPGLCIGTDIIVGFPGETEETFQRCCATVKELPLSHLHVFTYSPRKGTPAARMGGRVLGDVASRRANELMKIGADKKSVFLDAQMGDTVKVLCEEKNSEGFWEGWSDNYLRVVIQEEAGTPLAQNKLVDVRLLSHENGLASGIPLRAP